MTGEDELPIGRRVAHWRHRRNMTQQVFADRLGKSASWVEKIERGIRQLDRCSVLQNIADVLAIDVRMLTGREPQRRPGTATCLDTLDVEAIRAALERYEPPPQFGPVADPPTIDKIHESTRHAWLAFHHARYEPLTRALPKFLHDAQRADAAHLEDDDTQQAAHLLGQIYQITSSTLNKLGEHQLSWLAADRAIAISHRCDDPLLTGIATCRISSALTALGRHRAALEISVGTASHHVPDRRRAVTPQQTSVYGQLLLHAATAAAHIGDQPTVEELLNAADRAANQLGGDHNHYWTAFGPTSLQLHRAATAIELGEAKHAIEIHQQIDPDQFNRLMPERRAHHLLDLARAHTQTGNPTKAGEILLHSNQIAPAEIRYRPTAHAIMTDIFRATRNTPPEPIQKLAEDMGVRI
ncbi:helix-turn-helix transcriptional regulator [Micromonospora sonneratiae]